MQPTTHTKYMANLRNFIRLESTPRLQSVVALEGETRPVEYLGSTKSHLENSHPCMTHKMTLAYTTEGPGIFYWLVEWGPYERNTYDSLIRTVI